MPANAKGPAGEWDGADRLDPTMQREGPAVADDKDADLRVPADVPGALMLGAAVAIITRPLFWIMSQGTLGSILGGFDVLLVRSGVSVATLVVIEGGLLIASVITAFLAAFAIRTGDPRTVRVVGRLGLLYLAGTALYIVSVLVWEVLFIIDSGLSAGPLLFLILPLGISAWLVVLALRVIRSCRATLTPPDPDGADA
ncbi:hypothetical protein GCM10009682_18350 [Luedemannella flava]|uniref:DUF2569 domain-containing protein n=2 Tax=Luedemannella flava TaxID=349316 RepID=A0ABP4XWK5_9ACTN